MNIDVILGMNIDTYKLFSILKSRKTNHIIVIDYDYFGHPKINSGIPIFSTNDSKEVIKRYETVTYYKSLYIYPKLYERENES